MKTWMTFLLFVTLVFQGSESHAKSDKARAKLMKDAVACKRLAPRNCAAMKALLAQGQAALPFLQKTLKKAKKRRLAVAIVLLTRLRDKASAKAMLPLLKHRDLAVRHAAIIGVGILNPKGSTSALARAMATRNASEKAAICAALGLTRSPAAVKPLRTAVKDASLSVQVSAVRALGRIIYKDVVKDLTEVLKSKGKARVVRLAVIRALGETRRKEVVPTLITALKDKEAGVRRAAVIALGLLKDRRAVPGLAPLMRDASLVKDVVVALGHIRAPKALPGLVRIISARTYPSTVLEKAFWAIGQTGAKSAVKTLVRFLKDADPKVVMWAAGALGAIRDRRALEPLFRALSRPEKDVRLMLIWALQKISNKRFGDDVKRWEQWIFAPDRAR